MGSASISAYTLNVLISPLSSLVCVAFYAFCLLLTLLDRERDGLQLGLIASGFTATVFCRVSASINHQEPGRVAVGVRAENRAPMTFMAILMTSCAVVLGLIVVNTPSEAQCMFMSDRSVTRMRGNVERQRMFEGLFGKDGESGTSWQLHEHIRKPLHRETSFSFKINGGGLKGKQFRKHVKSVADSHQIVGYIMTTDSGVNFLGRAQGVDTDMSIFRNKLEKGSIVEVNPKTYEAQFDTETLMYKFVGFQVIHRKGMSKEDALKEALSPTHKEGHRLYTVDDDNTASSGIHRDVNSASIR